MSSKRSRAKAHVTSHGVIIVSTGLVLLLIWRSSGGASWATGIAIIILLGLVLVNYKTIIKQIQGV